MKKIFLKNICIFIITAGIIFSSCNDPSEKGGVAEGPQGNVGSPSLGYEKVIASDGYELVYYLHSATTSYEISLNMASQDIYINTGVPITMPMRIVGDPNTPITIHTSNNEEEISYFCFDLRANLELLFCNLKTYDKAVFESGEVLPPLLVGPGKTLTVGRGASLILEDYGYSAESSGGTLRVEDGGRFVDLSAGGLKIFDCGVSSLVIDKTATASLGAGIIVGEQETDLFQVADGSFGVRRASGETGEITYTVEGIVSLNEDWTVPDGQILHVKSGRLVVAGGRKLGLTKTTGAVILDANIELGDSSGFDLSADTPEAIQKIRGGGYVAIEEFDTGFIYQGPGVLAGPGEGSVFTPLANARIELSGAGIALKSSNGDPATLAFAGSFIVPQDKILQVESNVTLDVQGALVIDGGTLDVRGQVNVGAAGSVDRKNGGSIINKDRIIEEEVEDEVTPPPPELTGDSVALLIL